MAVVEMDFAVCCTCRRQENVGGEEEEEEGSVEDMALAVEGGRLITLSGRILCS